MVMFYRTPSLSRNVTSDFAVNCGLNTIDNIDTMEQSFTLLDY